MNKRFIGIVAMVISVGISILLLMSMLSERTIEKVEPVLPTNNNIDTNDSTYTPTAENTKLLAGDVSAYFEKLANGETKDYEKLSDYSLKLGESVEFIRGVAGNGFATYAETVSKVIDEALTVQFTSDADFNTRISSMLRTIDSALPAGGAESELCPIIDTSDNGSFVQAMFSLYRNQKQVNNVKNNIVTINFGGNVIMGDEAASENFYNVYKASKSTSYPFGKLSSLFINDDVTHLELSNVFSDTALLTDVNSGIKGMNSYAETFKNASVESLSLLDSHINDCGAEAFTATVDNLRTMGVATSYKSNISYQNTRIGMMAVISYNTVGSTESLETAMKIDIATAKNSGAKIVVVAFHWGNDLYDSEIASKYQVKNGRKAIDLGASLVIGTGPHVVQAIDYYKDAYIVYSAGDTLAAAGTDRAKADGISMIFSQDYQLKNDGTVSPVSASIYAVDNASGGDNPTYSPAVVLDSRANDLIAHIKKLSQISTYGKTSVDNISTVSIIK